LVALQSFFESGLVNLSFWEWLNVSRGSLQLISLGKGEDALEGRNDSLGGNLIETFNHWFVFVNELLAEDLVLYMETLDMSLQVFDNLDSV